MDKCDGIGLTVPLSPVKTMTAPCKKMQANKKATLPAFFMSAFTASADTRLRRAVSPFSPSTYSSVGTGTFLRGACPVCEERDRHCRRRQSLSLASECPSRFASARFRDEPS